MDSPTSFCWLALALCATGAAIIIEVDNTRGDDTASCYSTNGGVCKTLDYALTNGIQFSNTTIMIQEGVYSMSLLNLSFYDLADVAIYGAGTKLTVIKCNFGMGLGFFNVKNLTLANFTLLSGGRIRYSTSINTTSGEVAVFRVALYLLDCSDVTIEGLMITNSTGTGLVMYNVTGKIDIINSVFQYNMPLETEELPGDGGVSIFFTHCKPGKTFLCNLNVVKDSSYNIRNCKFLSNIASSSDNTNLLKPSPYATTVRQHFGRGGGLKILMRGEAQNNTISIRDCSFSHNQAVWGGGLFIELLNDSKSNNFILENILFDSNYLSQYGLLNTSGTGGGAVRIVIIPTLNTNYNTNFTFTSCIFQNNIADLGGGASFELIREKPTSSTFFHFTNCTWYRNIGRLGSAIDAYAHNYPFGDVARFTFDSCSFTENSNDYSQLPVKPLGLGTLYLWSVPAFFTNQNVFIGNNGSALVGISTWCIFRKGATAVFEKNTAENGGAITLLDNSYLVLYENTKLNFTHNTASGKGGAMYIETDGQRSFSSRRFCMAVFHDATVSPYDWKEKNVTVYFANNYAKHGNSIFTTTLLTCVWGELAEIQLGEIQQVYYWNGTFTYEGIDNASGLQQEISSEATDIENSNPSYTFPPGKLYSFDFAPKNDRNEVVDTIYFVTTNDSSTAVVDDTLSYTSESSTMLYGEPGSTLALKMVTVNSLPLSISINVKLDDCPPGFYLSTETNSNKTVCECSVNVEGQDYFGIRFCDSRNMVAYLRPAYYAGYVEIDGKETLLTAGCPEGYCYSHRNNSYLQLPPNSSSEALDTVICKPNQRTGALCGKCSEGNYIYVNSYDYECGQCTNSWLKGAFMLIGLKYIPLAIFLYIVGLFGISLVDGPLNSVALFSQLLPYMSVYAGGRINTLDKNSIIGFKFLYGMWNLDFFELLAPNFCVLPIQSALEMLLFKNLTPIVLGLTLSCLYYLIYQRHNIEVKLSESDSRIKKCFSYVFCKFCCKKGGCFYQCELKYNTKILQLANLKVRGHDKEIGEKKCSCFYIQSLITCVVLCYAKLTALAFDLLSNTTLYGRSKDDSDEFLRVFWLDGTQKYVEDTPWTLFVAIVCLIFVVLIPLVIILYPTFAYLYMNDNRNLPDHERRNVPENIKQSYGSLRLCYKSNRIACSFTGVYFLYRIGALAIYAFTTTVHYQYLWQCGFFLSMLLIHCVVQPYRKRIYNIIDGIVFFIMTLISLLSLYQLYSVDVGLAATRKAFIFQLILIYLPFVYIVLLWPCVRCYRYLKLGLKRKSINNNYIGKLIQFVDDNLLVDREYNEQKNENEDEDDEDVGQEDDHYGMEIKGVTSTSSYNHCSSKYENELKDPLLTTESKT